MTHNLPKKAKQTASLPLLYQGMWDPSSKQQYSGKVSLFAVLPFHSKKRLLYKLSYITHWAQNCSSTSEVYLIQPLPVMWLKRIRSPDENLTKKLLSSGQSYSVQEPGGGGTQPLESSQKHDLWRIQLSQAQFLSTVSKP